MALTTYCTQADLSAVQPTCPYCWLSDAVAMPCAPVEGQSVSDYQFDADAFHKELDKALNIAEGIHTATQVPAVLRTQAGLPILVARCPHCTTVAAIGGDTGGKHLCRSCSRWLDYQRAK